MSERLSVLVRKNTARLERPIVAALLAGKIGIAEEAVKFLDFEESDAIVEKFVDRLDQIGAWVEVESRTEVESILEDVRRRVMDVPILLIHDRSEETGPVELPLYTVLRRAFEILEFEGEDLFLTDKSTSFGLAIDYLWSYSSVPFRKIFRVKRWVDGGFLTEFGRLYLLDSAEK